MHWRFTRESAVLLIATLGGALGLGVYNLDFNLYVVALGLSSASLGVILAASTAGFVAGIVPAVTLADGFGRKRTLILGGLLAGPPAAVQCVASSEWLLVASGALTGIGAAGVAVVALPMLLESAPQRQQVMVLASAGALGVLGSAGGGVAGGWLPLHLATVAALGPSTVAGYRASLLLSLAVGGVTAVPVLLWFRDTRARQPGASGLQALADPGWRAIAWRMAATLGMVSLGAGWVIPYFNLFFTQHLGVSLQRFGVLSALAQVALGVATMLAIGVVRRSGVPKAVAATQLLSLPFLILLGISSRWVTAAPAFVARQSLMDMTAAVAQGWLVGLTAVRYRAATSSVVLIAANLPWTASAAVGGWLQQRSGFGTGFVLTSLCYACASLLWLLLFAPYEGLQQVEDASEVYSKEANPAQKSSGS